MPKPVYQKLGIKEEVPVVVIKPPQAYAKLVDFESLKTLSFEKNDHLYFVHLFAHRAQDLEEWFLSVKEKLDHKGIFWISWPKTSSGTKTDLTGNLVRSYGLANGLVDVKVASVNDTWSALKFVWRLKDRV